MLVKCEFCRERVRPAGMALHLKHCRKRRQLVKVANGQLVSEHTRALAKGKLGLIDRANGKKGGKKAKAQTVAPPLINDTAKEE